MAELGQAECVVAAAAVITEDRKGLQSGVGSLLVPAQTVVGVAEHSQRQGF